MTHRDTHEHENAIFRAKKKQVYAVLGMCENKYFSGFKQGIFDLNYISV